MYKIFNYYFKSNKTDEVICSENNQRDSLFGAVSVPWDRIYPIYKSLTGSLLSYTMFEISLTNHEKQKFNDKQLLMWPNKLEDSKSKINSLVPITPCSLICHRKHCMDKVVMLSYTRKTKNLQRCFGLL